MTELEHSNKNTLHHHFSGCSGVIESVIEVMLRSTSLIPSLLIELLFPPPLTLTDCRSDEMTGDQWALSSLEVAPGVTPRVPALFDLPSSACRAMAPSDFPVRGETGSTVQKFPCYFWVSGIGSQSACRANCSCNCLLLLDPHSCLMFW